MEREKHVGGSPYYYCVVYNCSSTTSKNPDLKFFSVPKNPKRREIWLKACRRLPKSISSTSQVRVCQNHFNYEEDLDNYHYFKLCKAVPRLKIDVVPHIFTNDEKKTSEKLYQQFPDKQQTNSTSTDTHKVPSKFESYGLKNESSSMKARENSKYVEEIIKEYEMKERESRLKPNAYNAYRENSASASAENNSTDSDPLQFFGVDIKEYLRVYTPEASIWPSTINLDDFAAVPTNSSESKTEEGVQDDSTIQPQTSSPESTPQACTSSNKEIADKYFHTKPEEPQEVEVLNNNCNSESSVKETNLQDNLELPNQSCCYLEISHNSILSQDLPEVVSKPNGSLQTDTSEILTQSQDNPDVDIQQGHSIETLQSNPPEQIVYHLINSNPEELIFSKSESNSLNHRNVLPGPTVYCIVNGNPGVNNISSNSNVEEVNGTSTNQTVCYVVNYNTELGGLSSGNSAETILVDCNSELVDLTSFNSAETSQSDPLVKNNSEVDGNARFNSEVLESEIELMDNTEADEEARFEDAVILSETQLKDLIDDGTRCSSGDLLSETKMEDKTEVDDCTSYTMEILVTSRPDNEENDCRYEYNVKDSDFIPSSDADDEKSDFTSNPNLGEEQVKKCFKCDKVFESIPDLRNHFEQHEPFICYRCSVTFKDHDDLINHKNNKKHKKVYSCNKCNKKFQLHWSSLYKHLESKCLNSKGKPVHELMCEVCDKNSFRSHTRLNSHLLTQLPKKERSSFKCPECSKELYRSTTFKAHMLRHTELLKGEYPFHCAECPKKFRRKFDIKMHMASHISDFKYVCNICGAKFTLRANLRTHKENIHRYDNHRYSCSICRRTYPNAKDVVEHLKIHSADDIAAITKKGQKELYIKYTDFQCQVCNKFFSSKSSLLSHHKLHTAAEYLKKFENQLLQANK